MTDSNGTEVWLARYYLDAAEAKLVDVATPCPGSIIGRMDIACRGSGAWRVVLRPLNVPNADALDVQVDRTGSFEFAMVGPQRYILELIPDAPIQGRSGGTQRAMASRFEDDAGARMLVDVEPGVETLVEFGCASPESKLSGIVRIDGILVPRARVHVRARPGRQVQPASRSDRDGVFCFEGEPGEIAEFGISMSQLPTVWTTCEVGPRDGISVELDLHSGSIEGVVVDALGPVSGASVEIESLRDQAAAVNDTGILSYTTTDSSGRFRFGLIGTGRFLIRAKAVQDQFGLSSECAVISVGVPPGVGRFSVGDVRVEHGIVVRGQVVGGNGQPVQGAKVRIWSEALDAWWSRAPLAVTSRDGEFFAEGMPSGMYQVWAQSDERSGSLRVSFSRDMGLVRIPLAK